MKSNRQKREQLKAKRARKAQRAHYAAILRGEVRPANAPLINTPIVFKPGNVPCDRSQLAPFGTYSPPAFYENGYDDISYRCADCGVEDVWTAKNQKWWYEVIKGAIYSGAKRCLACRIKRRKIRADANERRLAGLERKQLSRRLLPSSQKRKRKVE
ncbi:zinc-ribbon domain-containing protein [Blastopirellula sp. JC732]|uniref:Zinc-ribbon domain-containing protein n=1 Tax=Blastopirellula sediminis TaxID=2894196 RepID=A0A9X1MPR8_9BACT|nr:zinc-ribbon domain containing protein [Blastopirellula sediminis]MCC9606582.1 zinc-ribbon domain-containing protein [Blastopirellula sediminis]MCC9630120.1 zinc-ribbon domain-containing protein [Blastopirellula sediminis]